MPEFSFGEFTLLDLVLAIVLLGYLVTGLRNGFLVTLGGIAGFAAGAVAAALNADRFILCTDVPGVKGADGQVIPELTKQEALRLIADGTINGGMIPKVASCVQAVRNGVGGAHILDGRIAHVLLLEIFTDAGIGTMVSPKEPTP